MYFKNYINIIRNLLLLFMNNNIIIKSNSEKYIEELKLKDKIIINREDILLSENLFRMKNLLSGYYDVKYFIIENKKIKPDILLPNYNFSCGNCDEKKCYLFKYISK
jgi:hypothetical protein